MTQYRENLRRVTDLLTHRREEAERIAALHTETLHAKSARAAEIDRALAGTAMRVFGAATSGGDVAAKVAEIRAESEALRRERDAILASLGLPADYTTPHYTCPKCGDTGYILADMCDCTRALLRMEALRNCGAAAHIDTETFDTFSLRYYENDPQALATMKRTLSLARDFAEHFTPGKENLLLMGGTGLGKTHLSTAIARTVVERGYDVLYETVGTVFADFEHDQFRAARGETPRAEKYLNCDLLILDDLGTEFTNAFTVTCLYQIVNTRLTHGLSTVISTNLTPDELTGKYDERLTSRLLGAYRVLQFKGRDIRFQKLAEEL